jgi:cell shape-determining protein MreC
MKTYSGRRNVLLPRRLALVGAAFVLIALITLFMRLVFPGALVAVTRPLWWMSGVTSGGLHSLGAVFASPMQLQGELDAATAQITTLTDENKALAGQVTDLKKLLGARSEAPPAVLAGVLARPPESPYDTLIVDQGGSANVMPGALVTGPGGVPVGRVSTVAAASAHIQLFSSYGIKTDGWAGEARIPVTLTGEGGGAFSAVVPKDANLVVGDTVYVGDGGAAPVGTIVRLDVDPSSTAITVRIEPLTNPFSLTWVLISRT